MPSKRRLPSRSLSTPNRSLISDWLNGISKSEGLRSGYLISSCSANLPASSTKWKGEMAITDSRRRFFADMVRGPAGRPDSSACCFDIFFSPLRLNGGGGRRAANVGVAGPAGAGTAVAGTTRLLRRERNRIERCFSGPIFTTVQVWFEYQESL